MKRHPLLFVLLLCSTCLEAGPLPDDAAAVAQSLRKLQDGLQFLETEKPDLEMAAAQPGKVALQIMEDHQNRLTRGSLQFEYNLTPSRQTGPSTAIVADAWAMRVYVSIGKDNSQPTSAELGQTRQHTLWNGKSVWRGYQVAGTPWRVGIHVEGNQPDTIKRVQGIIDKELTELVKALVPQGDTTARDLINHLADDDNNRRAKAASELRQMLEADPMSVTDRHDRAFWEARLAQLKPGMTKADALSVLLPDATPAEREQACGSGLWSDQSGTVMCRLDNYWVVTLYLADFDNQKITLEPLPALREWARPVWVKPPDNYTGAWITYFVNGHKSHEIDYRNGKYHGTFTSFHDNGSKSYQQHYLDGVCHGEDTGWHRNGRVSYQGRYDRGKQVGRWRWWDEDGQLNSERVFEEMPLADRVRQSDVIALAKVDNVKVLTANETLEYQTVTCALTNLLKGKPVNNPTEVILDRRLNQQPPPDRLLTNQTYLVFLVGDWTLEPLTSTGSIIPAEKVADKLTAEIEQLVKQGSPIRRVGLHVVTAGGWMADTVIHSGGKVTGGHISGGERPFHHMEEGNLEDPALGQVIALAANVFRSDVPSEPTIKTDELVYITIDTFDRQTKVYQRPIKGAFENKDLVELDKLLRQHRIGAW